MSYELKNRKYLELSDNGNSICQNQLDIAKVLVIYKPHAYNRKRTEKNMNYVFKLKKLKVQQNK